MNSVSTDPQFVNPVVGGDFALNETSPAVNAGTDTSEIVSRDLVGFLRNAGSISIGAYESDSILSVNDEVFNNSVSIIPNPTSDTFTINLNGNILDSAIIYNQLGQQVKEIITNKVDISNLADGIYYMKITSKSGKTTAKKVIKN
ncbi:MAG: T9SS type A sorting domain-containing protein [Planctomycetia bacterium]|nr:T9SS type A sorting domain-containing protein [Planctomycetia bacterium]